MRNLSQRVRRLTPSINSALVLFAVGMTALLAYRAFDASRAQRQVVEYTLRDYAGFAAFQLKSAASLRLAVQHRQAAEHIARWLVTRGPTPPLGIERVEELFDAKREQCRCLDDVSFYYQVTFADSAIQATASEAATAGNLRQVRDTVIAQVLASARRDAPPLPPAGARGVQIAQLFFVAIFSQLDGRPYALMQTVAYDTAGVPVVAYGYAAKAEPAMGAAVMWALRSQPVLPITLTRGLRVDSILAVRVTDAAGDTVYQTTPPPDERYAVTDSLDARQGSLRFEVAIHPAAAGRLIIGGLPRSRLPEVLATTFVAVGLLGLLLYQFRRQEELGRLRDDFVSGVSHELRTPLAQIRLLADLLRMGKVPTEEQKERSLRIIDKEARRLSFLVDSILSFTHTKPGPLALVSTDVASELDEIIAGFEPLAQAHGVRLTARLDRGIVADVDRGALRQVLLNLLDNAVRYGPPRQTVTITTASAGDSWTLEVADEGPGIPADESERIFAPYYRMKRDAGGAVGGTGIGLAVVRRLVQEHGGRVHVAPAGDDRATGARFVVTLPIHPPSASGR